MNKTMIAVIGIVALGLLALGCTETTTVLPAGQDLAGISVSGSGSAFGEPDVAVLTLGVEAEAPTVAEARSEAAESMDATLPAPDDGRVGAEDAPPVLALSACGRPGHRPDRRRPPRERCRLASSWARGVG